MSKLLTADQAAKLLGVSRGSMYNYMRRGLLPRRFEQTRGLGRRLIFDADEVLKFKRQMAKADSPK